MHHHECGGYSSSRHTKNSDYSGDNSDSNHVRGADSVVEIAEDSVSTYNSNNKADRGSCVRGRCQCSSNDYTGPYCLVSALCFVALR